MTGQSTKPDMIRGVGTSRLFRVLVTIVGVAAVIAAVGAVHEGGHIAATLASGIPLSDIHWGGFIGINPAINYDSFPSDWRGPAIYYAGGLAGAGVALIAYLFALARYRRFGTPSAWMVAVVIALVVGQQVGNAVAEGSLHDAYLRHSPLTAYVQAVPAWVIAGIHAAWVAPIMPLARRLQRARTDSS